MNQEQSDNKFLRRNKGVEQEILFADKFMAIRDSDDDVVRNFLRVLDIIDTKVSALLGYLSFLISAAAIVLVILYGNEGSVTSIAAYVILFSFLVSAVAAVFALSTINIIGPHTGRFSKALQLSGRNLSKENLRTMIGVVTWRRRRRYLAAFWFSIISTVLLPIGVVISVLSGNHSPIPFSS